MAEVSRQTCSWLRGLAVAAGGLLFVAMVWIESHKVRYAEYLELAGGIGLYLCYALYQRLAKRTPPKAADD